MRLNIAIDGPSGAGKSTIAHMLAEKLGIVYLDTGAMYRAAALKTLRAGIGADEADAVVSLLAQTDIDVAYENGVQKMLLDGQDVSEAIREHRISQIASDVSKIPQVRVAMVELQRAIAAKTDSVLDGRDIGTYVLPHAAHKFYLTADIAERARRRYNQLTQKGEKCDIEQIQRDIAARDHNDMNRAFAPLKKADDAIEIDSTHLSIDETAEKMLAWVTSAQKSGGGESAVQTPQNDKKKTVKKKKKKKDKGAGFFRTLFFYLIKAIVYLPRKLLYPAKIIHKKRLPKKSAHIVVSNHLCWKDIIHHVFTLPRRRSIVAKQELAKSRFIRAFRKTAGIIFIDRENPSLESVREILKTLKRGEPISIFPEGTRNKDSRELLEIKPGAGVFAVKTGAPIIPVMVYKRAKTFRKNYLYVGEPLDLSAYKGMRLTSELTEEITAKVRAAMLRTMEEMDDYVENKRWKRKNKKAVTSDETT